VKATLVIVFAAGVLVVGLWFAGREDADTSHNRRRDETVRDPIDVDDYGMTPGHLSFELRVETASGGPAARARISYSGPRSGEAPTDAAGAVRVDDVPPGFYVLRARLGEELGSVRFELHETSHLGTLRLSGPATVSGFVHDHEGSPVFGAEVEAVTASDEGLGNLAATMTSPDAVAARATSASDGSYSLSVAAGERFSFRAHSPGFTPASEPARLVTIATRVDFHLRPGAQVAGHVVTPQGAPVAGAHVFLVDRAAIARGLPKVETVTRRDGSFDLVGEPLSGATIVVRAAGFAPFFVDDVRPPACCLRIQLERGIAVQLRVVDAETRLVVPGVSVIVDMETGFAQGRSDAGGEVLLQHLPTRGSATGGGNHVILWGQGRALSVHEISQQIPISGTLDLGDVVVSRGGVVRGRVLDAESRQAVAGAGVRVFGGVPPALAALVAPQSLSGPDGSFVLEGVSPNATHLVAFHAEYECGVDLAALLSGQAAAGGAPLFVAGKLEAARDVMVHRNVPITGVVRSPDGEPVSGATVRVADAAAQIAANLGGAMAETRTDEQGRFVLPGLRDSVTLEVSHTSYGRADTVTATAGSSVDITLRPFAQLRGEVRSKDGKPIIGARVHVDVTASGNAASGAVVSESSGGFVLDGLPTGEAELRCEHPAFAPSVRQVRLVEGAQRIDATILDNGLSIQGVVVGADGKPLSGQVVEAILQGGLVDNVRRWARTTTDAQGRFGFRGLATGNYALECRADRYRAPTTIVAAGKQDVRIACAEMARLTGRVLAGAQGVAGAQVQVSGANGTTSGAVSRADGSFAIDGLDAEEALVVVVYHDGYREARRADVRPGSELVLELEAGIQIGGTVVLEDKSPVPGALVEVRPEKGSTRIVTAGADGGFVAGGLPEGRIHVVVLESGQGLLSDGSVDAMAGDLSLQLVARRGQSITGMVFDAVGEPAGEVMVLAKDGEGRVVASAWVDRPGQGFALRGLAQGSYTVEAESKGVKAIATRVAAGAGGVELRLVER